MRDIWKIIKFSKSLWRYYLVVSIGTVVVAVINQAYPIFIKEIIDQITKMLSGQTADMRTVVIFVILLFVFDASYTLVSNISGYFGDQLSVRLNKFLSFTYYQHLLSLSQGYFNETQTGKIINRLNRSVNQISNFMQAMSNNFLQLIISTVLSLAVVYYYSWEVGTMLLILYPVFFYFTAKTSKKWQKFQKHKNEQTDIATGRFAEVVSQIKVVKSYNAEPKELKFFNRHVDKMIALNRPQSAYWHRQDSKRRLTLNLIFLGVHGFVILQALHGRFTLGEMVLLLQYAQMMRIPIFSMSFIVDMTQRAIADSKDYFDILEVKPTVVDEPKASKLKVSKGHIEFDKVSFAYSKGKTVLSDISFDVAPNSKVALVGESGEGKTTITNLLLRLFDPVDGKISIDSQNIKHVSQKSLRDAIGAVFQEPELFSGTIRENIAIGRAKSTDSEIINALKKANAWGFVNKLKDGLDAVIGERGVKLSGGQKQRIAIARAILKDAPILLLDEATSSLDSKSEHEVQKALEALMIGRSTIIIAHRLSTIAGVDKIVTIKRGKIDEIGSPEELANSGGVYSELLKLQELHSKKGSEQLERYDINV